jgi:exodeoxyribonuclease VII small subunit
MAKAKIVSDKKLEDVCFEEALGKLELIVKQLEKGELPLAESLSQFAEGINLSQLCLAKINSAETQIDKILQEERGKIVERPLQLQEENKC